MPASTQKSEQILAGLRRLSSSRRPGQTFTPSEIARKCGCHKRAIVFLERKAQYNLAKKLQAMCPDLIESVFQGRPITELFGGLTKNPYRTGKAFVRPKAEVKVSKIREVSLEQLRDEIAPVKPSRNWHRATALDRRERLHVASAKNRLAYVDVGTGGNTTLSTRERREATVVVQDHGGLIRTA